MKDLKNSEGRSPPVRQLLRKSIGLPEELADCGPSYASTQPLILSAQVSVCGHQPHAIDLTTTGHEHVELRHRPSVRHVLAHVMRKTRVVTAVHVGGSCTATCRWVPDNI